MRMHNPPHPGEILHDLWLKPLELPITRAAEALGVSRKTVSEIVNGRAAISPEMAVRLEIAFGKSAESWLAHQAAYDSKPLSMSGVISRRNLSRKQRLSDELARFGALRAGEQAAASVGRKLVQHVNHSHLGEQFDEASAGARIASRPSVPSRRWHLYEN